MIKRLCKNVKKKIKDFVMQDPVRGTLSYVPVGGRPGFPVYFVLKEQRVNCICIALCHGKQLHSCNMSLHPFSSLGVAGRF